VFLDRQSLHTRYIISRYRQDGPNRRSHDQTVLADGSRQPRWQCSARREIDDLWRRIMVSPDTYIMTPLEFKLFNHYRAELQVRNARVVLKAVRRYWDSNQGDGTM
jgi:HEPN domain-containing protein